MKKPLYLLAFPNPFQRLDHQGVPAATFPFDPSHSPDRRWVGATVDRSDGADGLPRTRPLETEGDLTAILPRGRLKGQEVHVARAPRKRIQFAFNLATPERLPSPGPTGGHYLLGFRQRSIIPADRETAEAAGVPFVEPKEALRTAAALAIKAWKREHGEEPDTALWPANLQEAAGIGVQAEVAPEPPTKESPKAAPPAPALEPEKVKGALPAAAPSGGEAAEEAHGAGGGAA